MDAYLLSPEALDDLQLIWNFIAADSVRAAEKVLDEFFDTFEKLAQWPGQGHSRSDLTNRDVRFWPVGSYLVVYREAATPPLHRRNNRSPATKKKNTTEITPFMVKNAALSFERSWADTRECS
jgi:plasmid stabilization system protein ParE